MIRYISPRIAGLVLVFLLSNSTAPANAGAPDPIGPADRDRLQKYARDTWRSMAEMAEGLAVPCDGLRRLPSGRWKQTPQTNPTDIGAYLWGTIAAHRLGLIDEPEAIRRLSRTLDGLDRVERAHGFLADRIDPKNARTFRKSPIDGRPITPIASSVDNGWLAAGLLMVRNAFPTLRNRAETLLRPMNFGLYFVAFDASDSWHKPGLIRGPYSMDRGTFGGFHRVLNTEQRIAAYIGIARGQIPPEHYYHPGRTLSPDIRDQSQRPTGEYREYLGIRVFEGHYRYRGMRIVPTWGGSMFEALMVTLFVPEERWAPRSWGVNHPLYVRAQIEHGLIEARYGYWGFSPASNPEGGYRTYGVDALGTDPHGYTSNNDDERVGGEKAGANARFRNGVVTPHASFLALRFAPREALDNLARLEKDFPIYSDHGFLDSVNVDKGVVSDKVLALDQGMILAAIANALADDAMRAAFVAGEVQRVIPPLIAPESFTAGVDLPTPPAGKVPETPAR